MPTVAGIEKTRNFGRFGDFIIIIIILGQWGAFTLVGPAADF